MSAERRKGTAKKQRIATGVWIFALFFLLFFLGTRFNLNGYELEYFLSAMNIYHGGGPELAPGFNGCPGIESTCTVLPFYPRQNFLQSYLSVPFYALGAVLFGEAPTIAGQDNCWRLPWGPLLTVSFLNPLLSVGIVILVMFMVRLYGFSRMESYRLAVLFGLSTMIWPYAGMGMEVIQTFFLTLTLFFAVCFHRSGKLWHLVMASLAIILLLNTKQSSFVFVAPAVIYLGILIKTQLYLKKRIAIPLMILVSLIGLGFLTGSLFMKFKADPRFYDHIITKLTIGGPSIFDFIYGLAISPGEGLFIFNPILILAIPAWGLFYRKHRADALFFAGVILIFLIALARVPYILMEEGWGPRYLHAILPILFVAGAAGILKRRTGVKRTAVITLIVISILIQALGSLYLGFQAVNAPIHMGIADYHTITFTPSLSQIYMAGKCFLSTFSRYFTGESMMLEHSVYCTYVGLLEEVEFIEISMATYDQPVGVLFTSRWVRAMMGYDVWPEQLMFFLTLALIVCLVFHLFWISGFMNLRDQSNSGD